MIANIIKDYTKTLYALIATGQEKGNMMVLLASDVRAKGL